MYSEFSFSDIAVASIWHPFFFREVRLPSMIPSLLVIVLYQGSFPLQNLQSFTWITYLTFLLTWKASVTAVMRCWWEKVLFLFNTKVASDSSMSENSIAWQKESSWQAEGTWVKRISQASKQKPWLPSWGKDERIKTEDKKNWDLRQHIYTHLYTAVTKLFFIFNKCNIQTNKKSIQFSVSKFMYKNISLWQ